MFAENARLFEYYVRIFALKIGDNQIWYGMYNTGDMVISMVFQ